MPANTNATGFAWGQETSFKTAPTSGWKKIEINNPTEFAAQLGRTSRDPISTDRNRRKGSVVSLRSNPQAEVDTTFSHLRDFLPYALMATATGVGTKDTAEYAVTAVVDGGGSPDEFTVAANGDLAANELIYARGMGESANNGLWVVVATSSATAIKVATGSLTAEASTPANATVEVAGYQGATGDLEIDASGDLISTTLDFTTLNLTVGQYIKIGGAAAATQFATARNNGWARITAIAANKLTLDRSIDNAGLQFTFTVDNGSGKTIQVFYGPFIRNVDTTDADFKDDTITFEESFDFTTPEYKYPSGNKLNQLTVGLPLEEKSTMAMAFMGADTPKATTSRKTGPSTATDPNATELYNTAADIPFLLLLDSSDVDMSVRFKTLSVILNNNMSVEAVLGTLGAVAIPFGNFHVDLDGEMLFENSSADDAARDNDTIGMQFALKNNDGAMVVDVPEGAIGDAQLNFERNVIIRQSIPIEAHKGSTYAYSAGVSLFPHIP